MEINCKSVQYLSRSVSLYVHYITDLAHKLYYGSRRTVLEFKVVPHSTTECSNVTIASSAKNGIQIHTDEASYVETQNGKLTVLNVYQLRTCRWPVELIVGGMKKQFIQPNWGIPSPESAVLRGYAIQDRPFWERVPFTSDIGIWCPGTEVETKTICKRGGSRFSDDGNSTHKGEIIKAWCMADKLELVSFYTTQGRCFFPAEIQPFVVTETRGETITASADSFFP